MVSSSEKETHSTEPSTELNVSCEWNDLQREDPMSVVCLEASVAKSSENVRTSEDVYYCRHENKQVSAVANELTRPLTTG